jgi:uracil-DNA glycosylase
MLFGDSRKEGVSVVYADANADAGRTLTLGRHHASLRLCRECPEMQGPPVAGESVISPVMLMGQAPGAKEIEVGRPFAWTAGRTLFRWFEDLGLRESAFRERITMSAVCRCYPGKNTKGGDRVPNREEVARCEHWWRGELEIVRPRLVIPVGRLAISRFLDVDRLDEAVGRRWSHRAHDGQELDLIPLPHPSGASTWFKTEPGRTLLGQALDLIRAHPAWRAVLEARPAEGPGDP